MAERLLAENSVTFAQLAMPDLADYGISLLNEILYHCACTGNVAMVELFLRHGADINQPRHVKTGEGVVERLANDDVNHAMIEWLLIHGAKVSHVRDGRPVSDSLLSAAIGGSLRIVRSLVEHGAPINGLSWNGLTALDLALNDGRTEVAAYLRSVGGLRASELTDR